MSLYLNYKNGNFKFNYMSEWKGKFGQVRLENLSSFC